MGRYPLDAMGSLVIRADLGFALETQGISLLDTYWFEDQPVGYGDATLLHELSHMWFGDSVAPYQWSDIWLNEGHASWYEFVYSEEQGFLADDTVDYPDHEGYDTVDELMHAVYKHSDQWRHDSGPVAHPIDADHLFDLQVYHGGALVLYALRQVVGARTFERIERAWVARYRDRVATTDDFIALIPGRILRRHRGGHAGRRPGDRRARGRPSGCSARARRRVVVGGLVEELRAARDRTRKPCAKPAGIHSCRLFSADSVSPDPAPERRGLAAEVDRDVEDLAAHDAHELPLRAAAAGSAARAARPAPSACGCPARIAARPTAASRLRWLKLSKKKPRASPNTFGSMSSTSGRRSAGPSSDTPVLVRAAAAGTARSRSSRGAAVQRVELRVVDPAMRARRSPPGRRLSPCRFSMVAMNWPASSRRLVRAGVEPGVAAAHDLDREPLRVEVGAVDDR